MAKRVFVVLVASLFLLPLISENGTSAEKESIAPEIESTLRDIGHAIQNGDPSGVSAYFAPKKILVSCPFLREMPDYYGSAQVELIFQRFFKLYRTLSFRFQKENVASYPDGCVQICAKWDFQEREGGKPLSEIICFTFEKNRKQFQISAIKTP